jgi:hypothetical protein
MDADAGERVAANASHLARMRSMSLKIKSASRKFNSPRWLRTGYSLSGVKCLLLARVSTVVNREFGMLYELLLDITTSWDATAEV